MNRYDDLSPFAVGVKMQREGIARNANPFMLQASIAGARKPEKRPSVIAWFKGWDEAANLPEGGEIATRLDRTIKTQKAMTLAKSALEVLQEQNEELVAALDDLSISAGLLLRQFCQDKLIAGDWQDMRESNDRARAALAKVKPRRVS